MVIAIDERTGQRKDDCIVVRYGATPQEWEDVADPDHFVEFIDGRLLMHSPVSRRHAELFGFLFRLLGDYVERRKLGRIFAGPFVMDLGLERKFEPDIMFITPETARGLRHDRLAGPADLAIEIASPGTSNYDRGEKRECYRVGNVREYWMVDPLTRTVVVDAPAGRQTASVTAGRVQSASCAGFWLEAAWLWTDPLPDVHDSLNEILPG